MAKERANHPLDVSPTAIRVLLDSTYEREEKRIEEATCGIILERLYVRIPFNFKNIIDSVIIM